MPRKTNRITKDKKAGSSNNTLNNYFSQIKWGESYTSLFLGAVVVVVALILVFSFVKSKNLIKNTGSTSTSTTNQTMKQYPKTYTVKQGDDLWSISEKIYGSGYNWVDLAKVNNLQNPDALNAGTKLTVANVMPREATVLQTKPANPITANTYTVAKGDFLWEIALRAYGDGYRWVDIAKANNLSNPDLIFSGNVLKLPR